MENLAMNPIEAPGCTLVLVDYQARLMPSIHRGAQAVAHGVRLADIARVLGVRVVGTEQNPAGLGPNDAAIRERCDATLAKMYFDACADGLLDALAAAGAPPVRRVVVAGCEAHVCLMQTALGLLRAGLAVWVVADACGSRTADNHALAMQRLRCAGAGIVSLEMVAFEWLRSCEHPRFRNVLTLLKQPLG
jgi:nicotinamidase-related amidase